MELADMRGSGPRARKSLWVQVPLPAPIIALSNFKNKKIQKNEKTSPPLFFSL